MELRTLKQQLSFRKPVNARLCSENTIVAEELLGAKDPSQHARGLMFRKLKPGQALIFFMQRPQRFSLHMWFVFSPIDVLFCDVTDEGFLVKEIRRDFRPFTTHRARQRTDLFIELPATGAKHLKKGALLIPKDI